DVVNACSLAKKAYSVYHDNPMDVIEQRILKGLNAHVSAAMAQKNIEHPVLSEIGLAQPEETGVLPELRTNLIKRMRIAAEVAEKRKRFKERGMKS
ncbi:NAD-dependent aldehyde dehydrogenase, partial [Serratia fonticola]